jgi:hypothetical protein
VVEDRTAAFTPAHAAQTPPHRMSSLWPPRDITSCRTAFSSARRPPAGPLGGPGPCPNFTLLMVAAAGAPSCKSFLRLKDLGCLCFLIFDSLAAACVLLEVFSVHAPPVSEGASFQ